MKITAKGFYNVDKALEEKYDEDDDYSDYSDDFENISDFESDT